MEKVWERTQFAGQKNLAEKPTLPDAGGDYGDLFVYDVSASAKAPTFEGSGWTKAECLVWEAARLDKDAEVTITDARGDSYTGHVLNFNFEAIFGWSDAYRTSLQLYLTA